MFYESTLDAGMLDAFEQAFGLVMVGFADKLFCGILHRFVFDVVKFDEYCHAELGYTEEEHGSLHDFIVIKSTEELAGYIKSVL
jgi:hypothetical protein